MTTTHIFLLGFNEIPIELSKNSLFKCHQLENLEKLKNHLNCLEGTKIIIYRNPYLDLRHFDLFVHLQNLDPNLKIVCFLDNLSSSLISPLQQRSHFYILWKQELPRLLDYMTALSAGDNLSFRIEKRFNRNQRAQVQPPQLSLPQGSFPTRLCELKNISNQGCCIEINCTFLKQKDFVNLTYLNRRGDYISMDTQVRWLRSIQQGSTQLVGLHFLACT